MPLMKADRTMLRQTDSGKRRCSVRNTPLPFAVYRRRAERSVAALKITVATV
jgi:hypothetical protein